MIDDIDPTGRESTLFSNTGNPGARSPRPGGRPGRRAARHRGEVCRDDTTTEVGNDEKTHTAAAVRRQPRPTSPPLPRIEGYELRRRLGLGGMGVVYLAEEKGDLRRQVDLKVIHRRGGEVPKAGSC